MNIPQEQLSGFYKAAAARGMTIEEADRLVGSRRAMEGDNIHKRATCRMATMLFMESGEPDHPLAIAYDQASSTDNWTAGHDMLHKVAAKALGRANAQLELVSGQRKVANGPSPFAVVSGLVSGGSKRDGSVLGNLLVASVLGGGALGAGAWGITREARESSAKNAILRERLRAIHQARNEIVEDLTYSGALDTKDTDDDQKVVEDFNKR